MLVQMAAPGDERAELARAAATVLSRRALGATARDCLPPRRSGAPEAAARPGPDAAVGSLTAGVPAAREPAAGADGRKWLGPLLGNAAVQRALGADEDAGGRLWAADAVALDLPVAELRGLADEVDGIAGVYPNRRLPAPPMVTAGHLPEQVLENRASSWGVERIGALAAWGAYGARGAGVTVGVLDTGVDAGHPDLAGRIAAFAEFGPAGQRMAATANDPVGHGTHCCGTLAGGNSSGQWIGVAPEARLVVGKVLDERGGTDAQVLAGLTWLIGQGVDVISMSVSGLVVEAQAPPVYTRAILTALRHGIPVIAAIGNQGAQTTGLPGNDLYALSVGAVDHLDRPAGFSGGRTQVLTESEFIDRSALPMPYLKPEVTAPGVAVVSAVPGGGWAALNGTSMAAPHVAGAAALLLGATRIRTAVAARERGFVIADLLVGAVDELGEAGQDDRYGFGRINALRAIGLAHDRGY
ncbi:S8 family serine peptidase [Actinoplanes nipponensis]|uniref:S8 family serine peptidase n=1 Tax=Actinoplanes nipponensis TaxID=135950 RepID=UPI001944F6F4|nr:S8 family serine peptidase [Actinoplanes nipponensis]